MNASQDDYLWDPKATPDPDVARLERLLKPHSAQALNLADRKLPLASKSVVPPLRRRRWLVAFAAAAAFIAGCTAWYFHRLSWTESSPWTAVLTGRDSSETTLLQVGGNITTVKDQTANIDVARIGTVTLAENSSATLIETRSKRHRLELKYGRLHAKVWAPPIYFTVAIHDATATDLGCEFDVESDALGSGRLTVISGWVNYRLGRNAVLVPEGHSISFDAVTMGVPLRTNADQAFRELVIKVDALLNATTTPDGTEVGELTKQIAATATDADYLTLLILMGRHRELADSAIYQRVEQVLGDPGEAFWLDEWWRRVPKPPKQPMQWWWNWRDAF